MTKYENIVIDEFNPFNGKRNTEITCLDLPTDFMVVEACPFSEKLVAKYYLDKGYDVKKLGYSTNSKNPLCQIGVPDLEIKNSHEHFLVEVKSYTDSLRFVQFDWIFKNKFPVKIVYVYVRNIEKEKASLRPTLIQDKQYRRESQHSQTTIQPIVSDLEDTEELEKEGFA